MDHLALMSLYSCLLRYKIMKLIQLVIFTSVSKGSFRFCGENFNPLTARMIFTFFGQFIIGQRVIQRSMGRGAPSYPP